MALQKVQHYSFYIEEGRKAEAEGDAEMAIKAYEAAIKQEPMEAMPFNRLMVLYRKSKKYDKELNVFNKAIKIFQAFYDQKTGKLLHNKKLEMASKALLKTLTPPGSKPAPTYPEPVPGWLKRRELVEKKLK